MIGRDIPAYDAALPSSGTPRPLFFRMKARNHNTDERPAFVVEAACSLITCHHCLFRLLISEWTCDKPCVQEASDHTMNYASNLPTLGKVWSAVRIVDSGVRTEHPVQSNHTLHFIHDCWSRRAVGQRQVEPWSSWGTLGTGFTDLQTFQNQCTSG